VPRREIVSSPSGKIWYTNIQTKLVLEFAAVDRFLYPKEPCCRINTRLNVVGKFARESGIQISLL
jgi:hypothetical protein